MFGYLYGTIKKVFDDIYIVLQLAQTFKNDKLKQKN